MLIFGILALIAIAIYEGVTKIYADAWAKTHNYRNYLPPKE